MIAEQFLTSDSERPCLKIGILLDGLTLPRCFAEVIDHIQQSNFATIELLIVRSSLVTEPNAAPRSKARVFRTLFDSYRRKHLAYDIYSKLDLKFFGSADDPEEMVDCTQKLSGIERLDVVPICKGFTHRFEPETVEKIRARDLDVILRFGFNILRGGILTASRYGIWSYHHGDNEFYRGGPALFWELHERSKLSGVILQVLTEDLDGGRVLAKALFSTATGVSVRRNRFTPYWGAVHLVIQKLYELHNHGWKHIELHSPPNPSYRGKRKIYVRPTNWELARWLIPTVTTRAASRFVRIFRQKKTRSWRIAIRIGSSKQLFQPDSGDRSAFAIVPVEKGHYYADPFLITDEGDTWLFFEDYDYSTSKGTIACLEVSSAGALGEKRDVLCRPYHLSYPFVFKHEGVHYLIPESGSNGTVELYRATNFPTEWRLEKVLFRGRALDTTLFIDKGKFWFFTTLQAPFGDGTCLCLFHSDRLDGQWRLHPASPISMDVRGARCAGRVFWHEGRPVRVSQDGAGQYGSSLAFREIVTLSETEYKELVVKSIAPWNQSVSGIHTYDHCCGMEVIDEAIHV